jgi:hypothetical protein
MYAPLLSHIPDMTHQTLGGAAYPLADLVARITPENRHDPFADDHEALTFHPLPKIEAAAPNVGRRAMLLPSDPAARKDLPITTGVLDYFPLAIAEVARVSKAGNDQHNPGQPLHWAKGKSMDHADCIPRHLIDRGTLDTDGMRHSAKLAWRALALLQTELEREQQTAELEVK